MKVSLHLLNDFLKVSVQLTEIISMVFLAQFFVIIPFMSKSLKVCCSLFLQLLSCSMQYKCCVNDCILLYAGHNRNVFLYYFHHGVFSALISQPEYLVLIATTIYLAILFV
jgi:hypothetical protein